MNVKYLKISIIQYLKKRFSYKFLHTLIETFFCLLPPFIPLYF